MDKPKLKILMLDNKVNDLHRLSKWLVNKGYQVFAVSHYDNALVVLNQECPDIIITNWMMPNRDGKRIVKLVREFPEIIDFIYIIVLTDQDKKQMIVEAFDSGVDDFLSKPICRQELSARLKSATRIIELRQDFNRKCEQLLKMSMDLRTLAHNNKELATTDELTGLANRREAMFRLKESWSLAERQGFDLSCLYIDIDKFKRYNDEYGHDVGDAVLKHIAEVLKTTVRRGEKIFRLGGEEFLVLCHMTNAEEAMNAGERLRLAIESAPLKTVDKILTITTSVGVATKDETLKGYDEFLIRADQALYKAKTEGRNLVCT